MSSLKHVSRSIVLITWLNSIGVYEMWLFGSSNHSFTGLLWWRKRGCYTLGPKLMEAMPSALWPRSSPTGSAQAFPAPASENVPPQSRWCRCCPPKTAAPRCSLISEDWSALRWKTTEGDTKSHDPPITTWINAPRDYDITTIQQRLQETRCNQKFCSSASVICIYL